MRAPSLKTLATILPDPEDAARVRHAIKRCGPKGFESHARINAALEVANRRLRFYGVEAVRDSGWSHYYCDIGLLYSNSGDTYKTTLIFDTRSMAFSVGTIGSRIEGQPSRFRY